MFGDNEIRKQDLISDRIRVKEIFYTIQGEGPFTGMPAVFVRLHGCNLACWFCDTDFEGDHSLQSPDELVTNIQNQFLCINPEAVKLVVITGGEPLIQNLSGLIDRLLDVGIAVQIETAGTVWDSSLNQFFCGYATVEGSLTLVCSPKTPSVHPMIEEFCFDWKYITRSDDFDASDGLPNKSTQVFGKTSRLYRPKRGTIWVQPCEEYNGESIAEGTPITDTWISQQNASLAAAIAMKYGYRLSLQTHKILGLK